METNESEVFTRWQVKYKNRRGAKSKLSVVGLLIELMSESDDESEEYNGDSLLMEIACFQVIHQHD